MSTLIGHIAEARAKDYLLYIEFYCQAPACAAREIEVRLKDYDGTLVARLAARPPRCPICHGRTLTLHHVRTRAEERRHDEENARASVNEQRRRRDHPDALTMPASVFCDTSLDGRSREATADE